jgi:hypothetical protein
MLGAVAAVIAIAAPARAGISEINQFRNDTYTQTGDGNALIFDGTFFGTRLNSDDPNEYDTVQLSYPGPDSPVALTSVDPTDPRLYGYGSPLYPDRAALATAFPSGTYTFSAANGSGTDFASYDYSTDAYPQTVPYLTGNDYTALQGLDAGTAFTFHFSTFTPAVGVTDALMFFTIFDANTNAVVASFDLLDPSTTSVTLAANSLQAGHSYSYELDFSDRVDVAVTGSSAAGLLGFDNRTSGLFTTAAVPEPSTLLLTIIGTGLLGCVRLRKNRFAAAVAVEPNGHLSL